MAEPRADRITVAAGIIWRNGRFLAARRPEGAPRAGFWEFPGGKREPGEAIADTLVRELAEELRITCTALRPWLVITHPYPEMDVTLHFFHVTAFTGEPCSAEGQELRWITPEEAAALPFLPADIAIVRQIEAPSAG